MTGDTHDGAIQSWRLGEREPERIVVLRALQLGDLLCAIPALRALRAALPRAEIVLVGLPWSRQFVERFNHYLDDLIELPGFPGLPEARCEIDRVPSFLAEAQARQFDLALQMHGSGSISNPLAVLLGAPHTAGFYRPGEYCPDPERFFPYPADEHEIWRQLRLMEFLGVPLQGDYLEFPVRPEDEADLVALDGARELEPGRYVCIHPGSRAASRRWAPRHFAAVADALAATGLRVVLTGMTHEAPLTRAVADAMSTRPLDLTGRTSLGALAALLRHARLLVSNDTGVSHVAVALRVPSVVIFTGSEPARWAPLDRQRHRVVEQAARQDPAIILREAVSLLAVEFAYAP